MAATRRRPVSRRCTAICHRAAPPEMVPVGSAGSSAAAERGARGGSLCRMAPHSAVGRRPSSASPESFRKIYRYQDRICDNRAWSDRPSLMASGPGAMPIPPRGDEPQQRTSPLRSEAAGGGHHVSHTDPPGGASAPWHRQPYCCWRSACSPAGAQAMTASMNTTAAAAAGASPHSPRIPGTHDVPGCVQAEDFDAGGEGVAYHDTEPANLGGAYRAGRGRRHRERPDTFTDVGWIRSGEWLNYTVNATESQTVVPLPPGREPGRDHQAGRHPRRTASPPGRSISDPTGWFDRYDGHISTPFTLPAGETTVRLSFDGVSRVNLRPPSTSSRRSRRPSRRRRPSSSSPRPASTPSTATSRPTISAS